MKLKEAIVHCDEIIKKMDNCYCRKVKTGKRVLYDLRKADQYFDSLTGVK